MPRVAKKLDYKSLTARQVADVYGVSEQYVGTWSKLHGCPRNEDKSYNLRDVVSWHEAWVTKQLEQERGGVPSDALERWRTAKAEKEELGLAVLKGRLVPIEEVERAQVARIVAVKRAFLAMPARLAPLLAGLEPREAQALMAEQLEQIIRGFAGQVEVKAPKRRGAKGVKRSGRGGKKR